MSGVVCAYGEMALRFQLSDMEGGSGNIYVLRCGEYHYEQTLGVFSTFEKAERAFDTWVAMHLDEINNGQSCVYSPWIEEWEMDETPLAE